MTRYPFRYENSVQLKTSCRSAFEYLDDPKRMSAHMGKSSMMMAGSKMDMKVDENSGRKIGSVISMSGRMLGLNLSLQESVSERRPPFSKTWETFGKQNLIILDQYKMGFNVKDINASQSELRVFIEYSLPKAGIQKILGTLLADTYARWCTNKMLSDAQTYFD